MRMQAVWNGAVVAESDDTVVVEGNHYFPMDALTPSSLVPSSKQSVCPWKGTATYYSVTVDGKTNPDAAWEYERPSERAREITGRVAFWRGVDVVPVSTAPAA